MESSTVLSTRSLLFDRCMYARALILASLFFGTGFLTGCLEGGQRDPYGNGTYSRDPSNGSVSFPGADAQAFMEPLGDATNKGIISTQGKTVHSEAELIAAIQNQTGLMRITIAGEIELSQPIVISQPLKLETAEENGGRLSFVGSGAFIVDNEAYVNPKIECKGLASGLQLDRQLYFRMIGVYRNPTIELKTPTHFVFDSTLVGEGIWAELKITSEKNQSLVVVNERAGTPQWLPMFHSNTLAKFVLIGTKNFSAKLMDSTLQHQPLLPINIAFASPSAIELSMPHICMSFSQIGDAIGSNNDLWPWSQSNERKCKNDGWFDEIITRQLLCVAKTQTEVTPPVGGAK